MPKRISKRPRDVNQVAHRLVEMSTSELPPLIIEGEPVSPTEISRIMAQMGRKGGKVGGKRRLETMSKAERIEIARKAAKARWQNKKS